MKLTEAQLEAIDKAFRSVEDYAKERDNPAPDYFWRAELFRRMVAAVAAGRSLLRAEGETP